MLIEKLKATRFRLYRSVEDLAARLLPPLLPLQFLEARIRPWLFAPYYHVVSDERVAHVINLHTYRGTGQFEADLDYFLKNFQPIELAELLGSVREGRRLKDRAFILTVDDGLREVHDVIAPRLKRKGVPAIFFITTAFLDNNVLGYRHKASLLVELLDRQPPSRNTADEVAKLLGCTDASIPGIKTAILSIGSDDRDLLDRVASVLDVDVDAYLADIRPYMTVEQVNSLVQDGFYIGAHSVDHFPYKTLTLVEQLKQTRDSAALIRRQFGLDYTLFAFPFSDSGVRASFFQELVGQIDLFFGTSAFSRDGIINNLQRFWMENTDHSAERILKALYARNWVRNSSGINAKKR